MIFFAWGNQTWQGATPGKWSCCFLVVTLSPNLQVGDFPLPCLLTRRYIGRIRSLGRHRWHRTCRNKTGGDIDKTWDMDGYGCLSYETIGVQMSHVRPGANGDPGGEIGRFPRPWWWRRLRSGWCWPPRLVSRRGGWRFPLCKLPKISQDQKPNPEANNLLFGGIKYQKRRFHQKRILHQ